MFLGDHNLMLCACVSVDLRPVLCNWGTNSYFQVIIQNVCVCVCVYVCVCVCVCDTWGGGISWGGYSPPLRKAHKKERMGLDGGNSLWGTPSSRAQPWSLFQSTEREVSSILGEQWEGWDWEPWTGRALE